MENVRYGSGWEDYGFFGATVYIGPLNRLASGAPMSQTGYEEDDHHVPDLSVVGVGQVSLPKQHIESATEVLSLVFGPPVQRTKVRFFSLLGAKKPPTMTMIFYSNLADMVSSISCATYRPFFSPLTYYLIDQVGVITASLNGVFSTHILPYL